MSRHWGLLSGVASVTQVVAMLSTVAVVGACGCSAGDGVSEVTWDESSEQIVAVVASESRVNRVQTWTSPDGREWTQRENFLPLTEDALPFVTLTDGTIVRIQFDRVLEVAVDNSEDTYRPAGVAKDGCGDDPAPGYQAIASDGRTAVVAMGEKGVSVRSATGAWTQHAVGPSTPE